MGIRFYLNYRDRYMYYKIFFYDCLICYDNLVIKGDEKL